MSTVRLARTSLFKLTIPSLSINRLRTMGLSKFQARTVYRSISHLVRTMGLTRALKYLKDVGDTLIVHLTGSGQYPAWVSRFSVNRRRSFPSFLKVCKGLPAKSLWRLTKLANFITFETVTKDQVEKFYKAVTKSPPEEGELRNARVHMNNGLLRLESRTTRPAHMLQPFPVGLSPLVVTQKLTQKGRPFNKRKASIDYASDLVVRSLAYIKALCDNGRPLLLHNRFVRDAFYPLDKRIFGQGPLMSDFYSNRIPMAHFAAEKAMVDRGLQALRPDVVGSLGFTQEPGGKLRVFASPNLIWQAALEPLKRELKHILKTIPQDCTFDQKKGAIFAQECLKQGITVHSVDLSNASDIIPFSLQLEMLRDPYLAIPKELVDLFEDIATSEWQVPREFHKWMPETIKWSRGQALGLGPSFGSFALWHNMLLSGICESARRYDYPYRVLGDDLIIADDLVYDIYCRIAKEIGLEISYSKSHSSNCYAEFAGYRITRDILIRPGKSRRATPENVVSLALEYESDLRHEVTEQGSNFLAKVVSLPPELGGLGLNLADVTEEVIRLGEESRDVNVSGELLERRLIKVYAQTGLFESIITDSDSPMRTHKAMTPYLAEPRFTEYLKTIQFGKDMGWFNVTEKGVTRDISKDLSVMWQLKFVARLAEVHIVSNVDTPTKLKICEFFRIKPNQTPEKLKRSLGIKLAEVFASSATTELTLPLVHWANKLNYQLDEKSFFRPILEKGATKFTNKTRSSVNESDNRKSYRVPRPSHGRPSAAKAPDGCGA